MASGKRPYVRFDRNDYSIPYKLVRKPLTVVASEERVRIINGTVVVAEHQRSYDKGLVIEDPAHIAELAKMKRHAHELRGRDLLRTVCKNAEPLLEALAQRGDNLSSQTSRLLNLLDKYGARELDKAMSDAFSRGALGAESVAHVLDQRARKRKSAPPIGVVLPDDPRVRGLRISQHSLFEYDALGQPEPGEDDKQKGKVEQGGES